jgi:hypothetical protein
MTNIMTDNMIRSYCLLAAYISVLCVMSSLVVNFTCNKQRGSAISLGSVLDVVCIQPDLPEASNKCMVDQKKYGRRPRGLSKRKDNSDMPDWSQQHCVTLQILPERATWMHKADCCCCAYPLAMNCLYRKKKPEISTACGVPADPGGEDSIF